MNHHHLMNQPLKLVIIIPLEVKVVESFFMYYNQMDHLRKVEETENQVKKEGVMVPLNAVGQMDGASYVLIISKGKVKLNEVEVAEETSNYARIISGLSSGLKVVARFDYELEDGQKVTIN